MHQSVIEYTIADTKVGEVLIAETTKGVCSVSFYNDNAFAKLRADYPSSEIVKKDVMHTRWGVDVVNFINEPRDIPLIPMDIDGTEFQRKVWVALLDIPLGKTATYKDIAEKLGDPEASRAVANACGANKIAILIPCHRVIASDGSLGGYSGGNGVETKKMLLESERKYNPDLTIV